MRKKITLEVCCGDIASVIRAREGGARRIELCSALEVGGLTPSASLIRTASSLGVESVNVLVRPRRGDFLYSDAEKQLQLDDAACAADMGATGIVCGALLDDGSIDVDFLRKIRRACGGLDFTFHRAFDFCKDPFDALEALIGEGCTTLLTSGQKPTAMEGCDLIARLVEKAAGRIDIMAGSGVNASNVRQLVDRTAADLVHASARECSGSLMRYRNPDLSLGNDDEWEIYVTSSDEIRNIINQLGRYEQN